MTADKGTKAHTKKKTNQYLLYQVPTLVLPRAKNAKPSITSAVIMAIIAAKK